MEAATGVRMDYDHNLLAAGLDRCLSRASESLPHRPNIHTKIQPIVANGRPATRLSIPQELSVGINLPFSGQANGYLIMHLPWSGAQRLWGEVEASTPLTPNDLTFDHLQFFTSWVQQWGVEFLDVVLRPNNLASEIEPARLAVEMPIAIMQTVAIEAMRRKMVVVPFSLSISVADTSMGGQALLAMLPSRLRQIKARGEIAA
ncbi:MAG: hypothetical protein U0S12_14775 [Fimbriimonadales bacterium]